MNDTPYSAESEQAVIGAALIEPRSFDETSAILAPSDFYRADHRAIWAALLAMSAARQPVDVVTVAEWIGRNDHDDGSALQYLATLYRDTPSAANAVAYAGIVRDRSLRRQLLAICTDLHRIATADAHQPVDLDGAQALVMALGERSATGGPVAIAEALKPWVDEISDRFERGGAIAGESWGLADLDAATSGLEAGRLYVVAGRPGMGKSVLGLQVATDFALRGTGALVFSAEMPTSECLGRIASGVGRVDYGRMRTAQFEEDDWAGLTAAVGRLNHAQLWFDDAGGLSIADVRTRSRRLKRAHPGLGLIVVDHIGLLRGEGRTENRTQEVGTISRGLKRLAKELALPVIALCQLNRGLESRADKRPVMSDLRESGDIEQDADTVIAVYRDEVYYPDSADAGCVELILRKCRGGPLTTVAAQWDGRYQRIRTLAGGLPSRDASAEKPARHRYRRGFDE